MENERERVYRAATLVVAFATALICMGYAAIFLDPQVTFNPFKPPLIAPSADVALGTAAVETATAPAFRAPIGEITPATRPQNAVTSSATHLFRTVGAITPSSALPSAFPYHPVTVEKCKHSSSTIIRGTVWEGTQPELDVRVRVSWAPNGPRALDDVMTHPQLDGSLGYIFVLKRDGSFGIRPADWYVWIVGDDGKPASDPAAAHVTTNNLPALDPNSCWLATVDFVR